MLRPETSTSSNQRYVLPIFSLDNPSQAYRSQADSSHFYWQVMRPFNEKKNERTNEQIHDNINNNAVYDQFNHKCSTPYLFCSSLIFDIRYIDTSSGLAFDAISMIDFDFDEKKNYCNNALWCFFRSFPFWAIYLDHLRFCSPSLNIVASFSVYD